MNTPEYNRDYFQRNKADIMAQRAAKRAKLPPKVWPKSAVPKHIRFMLARARYRATQKGLGFNLVVEDIVVPAVCPVLGIPIEIGGRRDHRPSLDRVDNSLGYVRGNVVVLSWRANRLKNDATIEELEAVLKYMVDNRF